MTDVVARLRGVAMHFPRHRTLGDVLTARPAGVVRAVDGIDLEISAGEVFAIVGESGCGKTTTANLMMGLLRPTEGSVEIAGADLGTLDARAMRRARRQLQMIFQDPYESLNPRMTVADIVGEPLEVHDVPGDREQAVVRALEQAGLRPASVYLDRRPHQLSGGQRQRVVIAAALVLQPAVLIADEPVSMLDVSIRADILNVLAALAREHGIAVVMITHDMSTVAAYADQIAVMYLGRIVETGPTSTVLGMPAHPYTQALVSVVPSPRPDPGRTRIILSGETPDPSKIPPGCRFESRCGRAVAECRTTDPELTPLDDDRSVACLVAHRR